MADAVRELYSEGQTDYSLEPIVLTGGDGGPVGRIAEGDSVVFCCRRGEREVQLTEAFTQQGAGGIRWGVPEDLRFVLLTLYHGKFAGLPVAFAPSRMGDTLAELVSRAGLSQRHVSESEKFAHVTFFLNGGNNQPFAGEEDTCVPSPRGVPFDRVPELSLPGVARAVAAAVEERQDLIVTNFANGDVIGHTTNNAAKIRCAELVDEHLGRVVRAAMAAGYVVFVTADHGNLERTSGPDGKPDVSHTTNPVPFLLIDPRAAGRPTLTPDGVLADVAPTVLRALRVGQPEAMKGKDLAPGHDYGGRRRVLLLILDGWGIGAQDETNAIFLARTPVWDGLLRAHAVTELRASGEAVGLAAGKAGNSEAGHLNIGAGRVVPQDDVRLDRAMRDGSFRANEILCGAIDRAIQKKAKLHLIGMLTEKSSHGSIEYPLALLGMARERGLEDAFLHLIFDGRSTEPGSAPALLAALDNRMAEIGIGRIATGAGRAFALDRGGDYGRTKRVFDALVDGTGRRFPGGPHGL